MYIRDCYTVWLYDVRLDETLRQAEPPPREGRCMAPQGGVLGVWLSRRTVSSNLLFKPDTTNTNEYTD